MNVFIHILDPISTEYLIDPLNVSGDDLKTTWEL